MKLKLRDIVVLSLMAALMAVSDFAMEALPNIHIVGVFIVVATVVYRRYALLSIYVYVLIQGVVGGFNLWWIPYLYIWTVLWGTIMLVPKSMPEKIKYVLYVALCAAHGFLFGVLYAPAQAIMFGLSLKGAIAWVVAGFTFDAIHGTGNLVLGAALIYPMVKILKQMDKYAK